MTVKLFVYGTLQRGMHNHIYLENANAYYIGEHLAINHRLRWFGEENPVPVIEHEEGAGSVLGEVWSLDIPYEIAELEQGYVLASLADCDDNILVYYPAYDASLFLPEAPNENGIYNYKEIYKNWLNGEGYQTWLRMSSKKSK